MFFIYLYSLLFSISPSTELKKISQVYFREESSESDKTITVSRSSLSSTMSNETIRLNVSNDSLQSLESVEFNRLDEEFNFEDEDLINKVKSEGVKIKEGIYIYKNYVFKKTPKYSSEVEKWKQVRYLDKEGDFIPDIIGLFQYEKSNYMVTKYEGGTLSSYIKELSSMNIEGGLIECLKRTLQILSFFNNHNIFHGDFHSKNIVVNSDTSFKVIDFESESEVEDSYILLEIIWKYIDPNSNLDMRSKNTLALHLLDQYEEELHRLGLYDFVYLIYQMNTRKTKNWVSLLEDYIGEHPRINLPTIEMSLSNTLLPETQINKKVSSLDFFFHKLQEESEETKQKIWEDIMVSLLGLNNRWN